MAQPQRTPSQVPGSWEYGASSAQAAASPDSAFGMQDNFGVVGNWFSDTDPAAHNEAVYDWMRSEHSAQTQRDWDKMMDDTQMQRKLADYTAAGFSPLAALEGGGNYVASNSAAARSSAAQPRKNNFGSVLTGIISAFAGLAAASSKAATAQAVANSKAETWKQVAEMRNASAMNVAKFKAEAQQDLASIKAVEALEREKWKGHYTKYTDFFDRKGNFKGRRMETKEPFYETMD